MLDPRFLRNLCGGIGRFFLKVGGLYSPLTEELSEALDRYPLWGGETMVLPSLKIHCRYRMLAGLEAIQMGMSILADYEPPAEDVSDRIKEKMAKRAVQRMKAVMVVCSVSPKFVNGPAGGIDEFPVSQVPDSDAIYFFRKAVKTSQDKNIVGWHPNPKLTKREKRDQMIALGHVGQVCQKYGLRPSEFLKGNFSDQKLDGVVYTAQAALEAGIVGPKPAPGKKKKRGDR